MSTYTINSGDTLTSIATKLGISLSALEGANPGVNPTTLQIGQVINLPGQATTTYTIQSGDTFTIIASKLNTTAAAIQAANPGLNPNALQVGATINIPSGHAPAPAPIPTPPAPQPAPVGNTYKIQAGDTFSTIASKLNIPIAALLAANPGVNPTTLQIGQTISLPPSPASIPTQPTQPNQPTQPGSPNSTAYIAYSGPWTSFPSPTAWAPYATLWSTNSALITRAGNATPAEIGFIGNAIGDVARESGIDARVLLCIVMQESGGNPRVGDTFNGVRNTGLMQAYDGASFSPSDPAGSIHQMIRDGAVGTSKGPGLKQAYDSEGNWYSAFRKYNSGSVNAADLNDPRGATGDYVQKVANRLMGHVWSSM